jgi:cholesterol oxidase
LFLRSLSVHRWAERSVILLVMQDHDNSLRLSLRRGRTGSRLRSEQDHGRPNPTYIPQANEAARVAAAVMNGIAGSALNEVLLDVPTSAHILGGAGVGDTPDTGVIDPYHRVFGHPGLHVLDGSAIGANLGVNPALTITAMAERAMSLWPNHGEADRRPPLGSPYRRLQPIPPRAPAVRNGVLSAEPWRTARLRPP